VDQVVLPARLVEQLEQPAVRQRLADRLRPLDDEPALGLAGRAPGEASYCSDPG